MNTLKNFIRGLTAAVALLALANASASSRVANFATTVSSTSYENVTITVDVNYSSTASPFGTCPTGKIFVGGYIPWSGRYFKVPVTEQNPSGWQYWPGVGPMPAYYSGPVCPTTIEIIKNMDVRTLMGTEVYVGVGYTGSVDINGQEVEASKEMLANNRYAHVYTAGGSLPLGVRFMGRNQVPQDTFRIGDGPWESAVGSGMVPYLDSGATLNSRQLQVVVYGSPYYNDSCETFVYADNKSAVGRSFIYEGCFTDEAYWTVGSPRGFIVRGPHGCTERYLNENGAPGADPVVCPF